LDSSVDVSRQALTFLTIGGFVMILQWKSGGWTKAEQALGIVFDAGAIYREDLALLLGSPLHYTVQIVFPWKKKGMIESRSRNDRRYFVLTDEGAAYVSQMIGLERNAKGVDAYALHQLKLNSILVRQLNQLSPTDKWYSTREASDLLLTMIGQHNPHWSEDDWRSSRKIIRPDAALVKSGQLFWIEMDNATEQPKQIQKKYHQYVENLGLIPNPDEKRVAWVTISEARRNVMEGLWRQWQVREDAKGVQMKFFLEEREKLSEQAFKEIDR